MNRYLAVMLGGALGSLVRFSISLAVVSLWSVRFPLATFFINVTGSFLIGVAMTLIPERGPQYLRPLIVTGILGGYTTFSSFEWEAVSATRPIALAYVLLSVSLGFFACWCGILAARLLAR